MTKNILFSFFALTVFFTQNSYAQDITSIADVRAYMADNEPTVSGNLANYDVQFTVTGVVFNGPELGPIRYIKDNTGYFAVYGGGTFDDVVPGDSIIATGDLIEFANLGEISNVLPANMTVVSSGNAIPEPIDITFEDYNEDFESTLVRLSDVVFQTSGTFSGNTNYDLVDADGNIMEIRVNTSTPLVGTPIPNDTITMLGIMSQFQDFYQVLPRVLTDFQFGGAPSFTSPIRVDGFTQNSVNISWDSAIPGNTSILYGLTEALEGGLVTDEAFVTTHEVAIDGLESGEIYFMQIVSTSESGETFTSGIFPIGTESESTGDINVYWNVEVNTDLSTGVDANFIGETAADTIIKYLDAATETIDMAIYSFDNSLGIISALNDAHDRGVAVRFVADDSDNNLESNLSYQILDIGEGNTSLRPGSAQLFGIMHNKFIIIDADSADPNKPLVFTGAMNFSNGQILEDPNDLISIQDQTLAKAYTLEMDEMMAGLFSDNKTNNTPKNFRVGGREVELYFSPNDDIETAMENIIYSADEELYFAILAFTRTNIAFAIENVHDDGVVVAGIIDVFMQNLAQETIVNALGDFVVEDNNGSLFMHHKFMVVDPNFVDSDPTVITGSTNWSNNAFFNSDENMIIIHDATIANIYWQAFEEQFTDYGGPELVEIDGIEDINIEKIGVYPNPVAERMYFSIDALEAEAAQLQIFDLTGKQVLSQDFELAVGNNLYHTNVSNLAKGTYVAHLGGQSFSFIVK